MIGVNNHVFGYERFDTCLYCFGNCLPEAPGIQSSRFLSPVPEQDDIFDEEGWFVRAEAKYMIVRDTTVAIPKDEALYRAKGITPERAGKVSIVELLRVLVPEYRTLFTATVNELQAHIPQDIPQMLQLAEWRHPDIIEEKPSETVTFRDIAAGLVTGDPKKYTNTSAPNTHWSFWPMGGAS